MDQEPGFDEPPRALGVRVGRYKNLVEQWVAWSDGMALFGANGSGKTNFLEALSILLGTDQTLRLAQKRLVSVQPGTLEFVCEVALEELPWAPSTVLGLDVNRLMEDGLAAEVFNRYPVLFRSLKDAEWWNGIDVDRGEDFLDGLKSLSLTDEMLDYLKAQVERPVIRYTLEEFSCTSERDDEGRMVTEVHRLFHRTLMGAPPPTALTAHPEALPDIFSPLRSALSSTKQGPDGFVDLIALSDVTKAPALLEWLPQSRTSAEVNDHVISHYLTAIEPATKLAQKLAHLPIALFDSNPDPIYWLHDVAAQSAGQELGLTLPYVQVEPLADGDAALDFIDSRVPERFLIGRVGDFDFLEHFSAGERRWVDEALATAARELQHFAATVTWQANLLAEVDQAELMWAMDGVSEPVHALLNEGEWWSGKALANVQKALEGPLLSTARRLLAGRTDPMARGLLEASVAGLSTLRPQMIVRVFDEPEAHLHPAAQRQVSLALERLRLRGANVILASHSPHFLDLPGWHLLHLQQTPEGATVSTLIESDLDARKSLAGQMGMTRGELLTRISLLLNVEGEQDGLFLETLYGRRLKEAGVTIVRMHGTSNLLATAELDFIERHLDVPIGVLLDDIRLKRVEDGHVPDDQLTDEEQALCRLTRAGRHAGRTIETFGLERPDIVAYLNEDVIRMKWPDFPGWGTILPRFRAEKDAGKERASFKPWLARHYGVDLTRTDHLLEVLQLMADNDLPAAGELAHVVHQIELAASEGRWPSDRSRM